MGTWERIRELGVLRAAGMSRRQVWRSVLVEAGILGTIGGIAGSIAGLGVGALLVAFAGGLGVRAPGAVGIDRARPRPRRVAGDAGRRTAGPDRRPAIDRVGRPERVGPTPRPPRPPVGVGGRVRRLLDSAPTRHPSRVAPRGRPMSYALPSMTRVPAAEKGLTIADFLVPVRVGERVSPRLRNVALVVAGSLLIYLTAQIAIPHRGQPGADHAPELRRAGRRRVARPSTGRPRRVPVRRARRRRAAVLRGAQGRHGRHPGPDRRLSRRIRARRRRSSAGSRSSAGTAGSSGRSAPRRSGR